MITHIALSLIIGGLIPLTYACANDSTWVEVDNVVYGAKPDERGPIGGGAAYADIFTSGDYTVEDLADLIKALSRSKSGDVVFIPGETEIDLTSRILIEQIFLYQLLIQRKLISYQQC